MQAPAHAESGACGDGARGDGARGVSLPSLPRLEPVHDTPAEQAEPGAPRAHALGGRDLPALRLRDRDAVRGRQVDLVGGYSSALPAARRAVPSGASATRTRNSRACPLPRRGRRAPPRPPGRAEGGAQPVSAPAAPVAADEAPGGGWRGWFGWGRDNLARVKGIDEAREKGSTSWASRPIARSKRWPSTTKAAPRAAAGRTGRHHRRALGLARAGGGAAARRQRTRACGEVRLGRAHIRLPSPLALFRRHPGLCGDDGSEALRACAPAARSAPAYRSSTTSASGRPLPPITSARWRRT